MSDPTPLRMVRAAQNQALCREVNERIDSLSTAYGVELSTRDFICECAATDCTATIRMTVSEYEEVRQDATRFVVLPSEAHVIPDVEEVVSKGDRYWTVSKVGAGAEIAARLDPRRRARSSEPTTEGQ
jgi:hypothetical protein